ncbi:HNH endonuclease [Alicyclobacillus curvatus]|nr:HNH endonuclease [Alicyclobacillus curvatus]
MTRFLGPMTMRALLALGVDAHRKEALLRFLAAEEDGDTLEALLCVRDEEVDDNWGPWTFLTNDSRSDIEVAFDELNPKRKAAVLLWRSKRLVVSGWRTDGVVTDSVYAADYEEFTVLVKFSTGEVYFFDQTEFKLVARGRRIYLVKREPTDKETPVEMLVYDGTSGIFLGGRDMWLRKSNAKPGKRSDMGIQWSLKKGIGPILLKHAHIIAVLYFGLEALEAFGEMGTRLVINHRNLDPTDNRIVNLELVTRKVNSRHGVVMGNVFLDHVRIACEMINECLGAAEAEEDFGTEEDGDGVDVDTL